MLWMGGDDKALPAVLHRNKAESLESFVYNSLSGVSFFETLNWDDDYRTRVAQVVWEMVGEASVPATRTSGGT